MKYFKITSDAHKLKADEKPVQLAVFDFDGTCIYGNSPVTLVKHLFFSRMCPLVPLLQIGCWGFAYHFHLPQNEAWVRGKVFECFKGMPCEEVDAFLRSFYDEKIEPMWLDLAQQHIDEHKAAGDEVLWVSATFEAIVERAAQVHGVPAFIVTRMRRLEDGTYSNQVEGKPMEGVEKLRAVQRYADAKYGVGKWELAYVYADHYSDKPLLAAAKNPRCINPGPTLRKHADKVGWPCEMWDLRKQQD